MLFNLFRAGSHFSFDLSEVGVDRDRLLQTCDAAGIGHLFINQLLWAAVKFTNKLSVSVYNFVLFNISTILVASCYISNQYI